MSFLDLIFRTSKPKALPEGAVVIKVIGDLVDANGETEDFATFEDELIEAVEGSGAVSSTEMRSAQTMRRCSSTGRTRSGSSRL